MFDDANIDVLSIVIYYSIDFLSSLIFIYRRAMSSLRERFIYYLKIKGLDGNLRNVERMIGLSNGAIDKLGDGTRQQTIDKISTTFPDLNTAWLKTGVESAIKGVVENAVPIHISDISVTIAPLIGQYAQAGYLNGYADPEYLEKQPMYYAIKKYSGGNYVAFEVRGDSMDNGLRNAICTGDIILGRELYKNYWLSKLHIPRIFIIVHEDGICCKEIIDHDVENGIITCHSYNPDKNRYPDYQVHLKDVRQLFYMKELRRGND